jgi:hypothetical protein
MKSIFVVMRSEGDPENPLTAFSIAKAIMRDIDLAMLNFPRIEVKDKLFMNRTTYTVPYVYGKTIDDVVDIQAIQQLFTNFDNMEKLTYKLNIPKFRDNFINRLYKEAERISQYDIAFFSVFRFHLLYHLLLAAMIKDINKNIKIVFGGPQIILSKLTRNLLQKCTFVDTTLIGNIEDCLPSYLMFYPNLPKVMMVKNSNNINNIIPVYYPFTKIFDNTVNLFSSRNCSMLCSYCPNGSKILKYQKVKLDIFSRWLDIYSSNKIYLTDPFINLISKRFLKILDILKETNFKGKYIMWTDPKKLTFEQVDKICDLKPRKIWLAYDIVDEKFSIKHNRFVNKITDEKIKTLTDSGINTLVPFIIGLPGETKDIFNKTLKKIEMLKLTCNGNLSIILCSYLHNVGSPLFHSDPNYLNGVPEDEMKKRLSMAYNIIDN